MSLVPHPDCPVCTAGVPEQEPVGWISRQDFEDIGKPFSHANLWPDKHSADSVPLYAAPPPEQPAASEPCGNCHRCVGGGRRERMILCPTCGNKRCPKASDHRLACTDSNEPGQPGSVYPRAASEGEERPWCPRCNENVSTGLMCVECGDPIPGSGGRAPSAAEGGGLDMYELLEELAVTEQAIRRFAREKFDAHSADWATLVSRADTLCLVHNDLRSVLSALTKSAPEWRSIETAPKDGTHWHPLPSAPQEKGP